MIKLRADIDKNEFYEPSDGCEFDCFYITAAELEQREADTSHVSNLEMLVVRLARHIAKLADGDSKLADQAFDYIKRKGVGAGTDILRFDMQQKTEIKEAK